MVFKHNPAVIAIHIHRPANGSQDAGENVETGNPSCDETCLKTHNKTAEPARTTNCTTLPANNPAGHEALSAFHTAFQPAGLLQWSYQRRKQTRARQRYKQTTGEPAFHPIL